jgi:hypothetical protein
MLQKHAHYNDLSPELRKQLEEKVKAFGETVRFKFNISRENPDPEKYNGPILWPSMYVLDPKVFRITDKLEKRPGASNSKEVGLVNKLKDDGKPESFHSIRVFGRNRGVLVFKPQENVDDFNYVMYLLMHPKLSGGIFQNKNMQPIIELIDEKKEAEAQRERRSHRAKALAVATNMKDEEVKQFADAMLWDSNIDPDALRNQVETLAEEDPKMFNDLIGSKNLEYQALIKQAMDKQVIAYNPAEFKYMWFGNQQVFATLSPVGNKNEVEKLSEWLQTGGKNADEVFGKIKSLVK